MGWPWGLKSKEAKLSSHEQSVREATLRSLAKKADPPRAALVALGLADPVSEVRVLAGQCLAQMQDANPVLGLDPLVGCEKDLRKVAATGHPLVLEILQSALEHEDSDADEVVDAFEIVGDPALASLRSLATDRMNPGRVAAARALGRILGQSGFAEINQLFADDMSESAALHAVAETGADGALDILVNELGYPDDYRHKEPHAALTLLHQRRPDLGLEKLVEVDPSDVFALEHTRHPLATDIILARLHATSDPSDRAPLIKALEGSPVERVLPVYIAELGLPNSGYSAIGLLGELGDARAVEPLMDQLDAHISTPEFSTTYMLTVTNIARALGKLGDVRALDKLRELAEALQAKGFDFSDLRDIDRVIRNLKSRGRDRSAEALAAGVNFGPEKVARMARMIMITTTTPSRGEQWYLEQVVGTLLPDGIAGLRLTSVFGSGSFDETYIAALIARIASEDGTDYLDEVQFEIEIQSFSDDTGGQGRLIGIMHR